MKAHPDRQYPVQLGAGETLLFHTRAGSSLISTSGSLVVTGTPLWLGEQVFRTRVRLEPGQAHLIEQDGWITLTAGSHGKAACLVRPEAGPPSLMGALGKAGKELLRRFPGIARIAGTRFRSAWPVWQPPR